jgi:glycine N-methyltransferase
MVDSVYRTRSLGVAAEGLPDQYADGRAARVWHRYIGSVSARTSVYRSWISNFFRSKGLSHILDVACGTGIDSVMLLEEGFRVTSVDASDKMLKFALRTRWARRKEPSFDDWVIEEANWLSLPEADVEFPPDGFDAVMCLGNSFAHLQDFDGTQDKQRLAIANFHRVLKPGGYLIIDHRNYDAILDTGKAPAKNIYYQGDVIQSIHTSCLYVEGRAMMVTLDYYLRGEEEEEEDKDSPSNPKKQKTETEAKPDKFRLSYYPHRVKDFTSLLKASFGEDTDHTVLGDFKPLGEIETPAYFIHIIQKKQSKD